MTLIALRCICWTHPTGWVDNLESGEIKITNPTEISQLFRIPHCMTVTWWVRLWRPDWRYQCLGIHPRNPTTGPVFRMEYPNSFILGFQPFVSGLQMVYNLAISYSNSSGFCTLVDDSNISNGKCLFHFWSPLQLCILSMPNTFRNPMLAIPSACGPWHD